MNEQQYSLGIIFRKNHQIEYFHDKKLIDILHILDALTLHWELVPVENCKLNETWYFYADERNDNGDSWPEFQKIAIEELRTM